MSLKETSDAAQNLSTILTGVSDSIKDNDKAVQSMQHTILSFKTE